MGTRIRTPTGSRHAEASGRAGRGVGEDRGGLPKLDHGLGPVLEPVRRRLPRDNLKLSRREFVTSATASGVALSVSPLATAEEASFAARETLPGRQGWNPGANGRGRVDGVAKSRERSSTRRIFVQPICRAGHRTP